MHAEKTRTNRRPQQATQVGKAQRNQIYRTENAMREYHEVFGHEHSPLP